jgi:hypothetical protein
LPISFALPYRAAQVELTSNVPGITVPPPDWRFWVNEDADRAAAIPLSALSAQHQRLWLIVPSAKKDGRTKEIEATERAIRNRLVLRRTANFKALKVMELTSAGVRT